MVDCSQGVLTNDQWKKLVRTHIADSGKSSRAAAAEDALRFYAVKDHSLEEARRLNMQVLEEIEAARS